jgi:tetratricopeptide (TPR) repeat protein
MGNFQRAEQIIRKVGEEHGNTFSWYNWCMRSGHGDVKAARALLMQAADQADQAGQPLDALSNRAWVAELEGDPKTAKPMLLRLATEKHDPQAGMELAFMAADAGDAAERDNMLNLVAEQPLTDSPPIPNPILPLLRSFFHHDGVLDPALLKNVLQLMPTDEICPEAILYYDLGRAYLSRGEKAKAIENFRHAAGLNSHRVSRALAAMQLRKLGEPVPPPGQWGPPQK